MSDVFRFETFVDAHSSIFNEYLSSVIAKLPRENEEYRAVQAEIESPYEKYPKVLGVFDSEQAAGLTKEECAALIKVWSLGISSRIRSCNPSTSVAAMTAWGI